MIMNIGEWIYGIFGDNGEIGILIGVFLIFLLDAFVIPTLPELFFVLGFMGGCEYQEPLVFGGELLLMAILAELIGILSLYYVVKHIKVPKKIEKAIGAYTNFLILDDERLLLLNRIAPMIPFAGAFIAISNWKLSKSLVYIVIGCICKYGLIMLLSNIFYEYFSSDTAGTVTLLMIFIVIGASIGCSFYLKKRNGGQKKDNPPDQE